MIFVSRHIFYKLLSFCKHRFQIKTALLQVVKP
jgi:hypothetical protein